MDEIIIDTLFVAFFNNTFVSFCLIQSSSTRLIKKLMNASLRLIKILIFCLFSANNDKIINSYEPVVQQECKSIENDIYQQLIFLLFQ